METGAPSTSRLRILTVGDGDLTLSLALSRAYGSDQIDLIASTLCSSHQELCHTYENAKDVVVELAQRHVPVRYGVDATQLHGTMKPDGTFDIIVFFHPHLGYSSLLEKRNDDMHAERHFILLAHYLKSAQSRLKPDGSIHLCLCGTQPQTWRVFEAAERQGLVLRSTVSTTCPPHTTWLSRGTETSQNHDEPLTLKPVEAHFSAPRKFRNGKLGSKHYLGKYGYMHRRNHGRGDTYAGNQVDTNVNGSVHLIFTRSDHQQDRETIPRHESFTCSICGKSFQNNDQLELHKLAPALPDALESSVIEETEANGSRSSLDVKKGGFQDAKRASQNEDNGSCPKRLHSEVGHAEVAVPSRLVNDNDIVRETLTVGAPNDGKRLRWYLRQPSVTDLKLSRKQCDDLIARGRVAVNGRIVFDSGRVLHTGDAVSIIEEDEAETAVAKGELAKTKVFVVRELKEGGNSLLVVFKPVGMRTIGNFSSQTLEMTVSRARGGHHYRSISKLDTGCSGLCVLQEMPCIEKTESIVVTHVFTALVHGTPPQTGTESPIILQLQKTRKWRNRGQAVDSEKSNSTDNDKGNSHCPATNEPETICIECTEQTNCNGAAELSSLRITTSSNSSGLCNAICYQLRKLGHPVVNDRLCQKEFMALPRPIRNTIKKKLCIGCFHVEISIGSKAVVPISINCPDRLSALFWEKQLLVKR